MRLRAAIAIANRRRDDFRANAIAAPISYARQRLQSKRRTSSSQLQLKVFFLKTRRDFAFKKVSAERVLFFLAVLSRLICRHAERDASWQLLRTNKRQPRNKSQHEPRRTQTHFSPPITEHRFLTYRFRLFFAAQLARGETSSATTESVFPTSGCKLLLRHITSHSSIPDFTCRAGRDLRSPVSAGLMNSRLANYDLKSLI